MKSPLAFRLKLALLTGVLRLLGRIVRASAPAAKPGAVPANASGRVIDGESRRIDDRYNTY